VTGTRSAVGDERVRKNLRTGLLLGAVALAFVLLFILKIWQYG
jgi:hypothetical protein